MATITATKVLVFRIQEINFTPDPSENQPNPSPIVMSKVHYLDDFEGSGREQQRQNIGKQAFKVNADVSLFHRMQNQKIPGFFDIDFVQSVDSKTGKPILKIKDMRPTSKDEQQEQQQK